MLRLSSGRRLLTLAALSFAVLLLASPGHAQTGMLKGKVVDVQNKPVEDATVTIQFTGGIDRKYEVKTNKRGEFIQIGLPPGTYKVTADKEKVGSQTFDARVRLGEPAEVNFVLGAGGPSKEDQAKAAAWQKMETEASADLEAGKFDEAIAKYDELAAQIPNCALCYANAGGAAFKKKDYAKAEEYYNKSIATKPTQAGYDGLMNVYNAQKKFDQAAEMSKKSAELAPATPGAATGGGNPDALYNQAVIAINGGKMADAQEKLAEVLKVKPDHAEAHFWMANTIVALNLNDPAKLAEAITHFEKYLELAPNGPKAAEAKSSLEAIKAMVKK